MSDFRMSAVRILRKYYSYVAVVSMGVLTLSYQNCGSSGFDNKATLQSSASGVNTNNTNGTKTSCTFNGAEVLTGTSVDAYQNSLPPTGQSCIKENRICTSGILSGSYNFPTCSTSGTADCMFNGSTVKHGSSIAAYVDSTVNAGSTCSTELRTCSNGTLSGSYQYASCVPGQASSCLFNGVQIPSGQSVLAFQASSVTSGMTCTQESRVCTNGNLSGSFTFATCNTNILKSCLFNGKTIAHGESVNAYSTSTVASGATCSQQSRLCNDGDLSGTYTFDSCVPGAPASCSFSNRTVVSGGTVKAYKTATVAAGQACVAEDRHCTNGSLDGSYTFGSCVAEPEPDSVMCPAASKTAASPDGSNNCTFTWSDPKPPGSLLNYTSGGGALEGICQDDGQWKITNLMCPNKIVSSCDAGSAPVVSPDGSNSCNLSWSVGAIGQNIVGMATGGGSVSGTCQANGTWSYSYLCPNKTGATCAAGAVTVPSPDSSNSCVLSWVSGTQGQSINGTASNGGSVSGTCLSNGNWTYSYVCPNKSGATCAGGSVSVASPDSSNSCALSWGSASQGQSINGIGTNGGSVSGSCQANGNWSYTYVCPNKTGATCVAGASTVNSPDSSNSCALSWVSGTQGQSINGTGTNGGSVSGTCQSNGSWSYSYVCPNKVGSTCNAGSVLVSSPDSSNSCVLSWASGGQGQSISGTGTNGGSVSGSCQANGNWSYTYVCPNKVGATCVAGSATVASPDNSNSCVLSWASGGQGQSISGTATNGGSVSGTCQSNGNWSYTYVCPNKVGATCTAGSMDVKSPNDLKTCTLSWAAASAGKAATGTGTNGGSISGTCGADGLWTNIVASCPN